MSCTPNGSHFFVARQPIFNQHGQVFAYELLFRSSRQNMFCNTEGTHASTRVISDSFLNIGIDNMTGGKKAFINFTRDLLLNNTAQLLPNHILVVEILENIEPDPEVLQACRKLKRHNYQLVLDDFLFDEKFDSLMALVDIVKIDFLSSSPEQRREVAELLPPRGVLLLAEKIETQEDYEEALDLGYHYFQGYFFSRPVIISGTEVPASAISYGRILGALNKPELDFDELEAIIKSDFSLSCKLMRYINSAAFAWIDRIESIKRALMLLGAQTVRRFISLVIVSAMVREKPEELIAASLVRANLCEALAPRIGLEDRKLDLFFMGMFSMMDAILDRPMEEALSCMPVADDVRQGLLGEDNVFRDVFRAVVEYERGDWDEFTRSASRLSMPEDEFPALYLRAVEATEHILREKTS